MLHTVEYAQQDEGLDDADLRAGWEALAALGEGFMVIFNGGVEAGASVAHRHLQVIPKAGHVHQIASGLVEGNGGGECGCEMFVGLYCADLIAEIGHVEGLPYQHGVVRLPAEGVEEALFAMYTRLLKEFDTRPDEPHNMLLTSQWMVVIPRTKAWIGDVSANAASMVGMVWCKTESQYEGWLQMGITEVLREMGKAWETG